MALIFSGCEKEILESDITLKTDDQDSELNDIASKYSPGHFFYMPQPGEVVGFEHVPYSGSDSMIVEFHKDLMEYDSMTSISSKWKNQFGIPLWGESVVMANEKGHAEFAIIPFVEEESAVLKTIFVLARHEGYWFFEGWNVRLVEKAIEMEGEPDENMQTLIDFYQYYQEGYWDPGDNSGNTTSRSTVCERVYYINHTESSCLRVCIKCEIRHHRPFVSVNCPEPYEQIVGLSISSCLGGGVTGTPPQNIRDWTPYYGSGGVDEGNPLTWGGGEGIGGPNWPGGVGSPVDNFDDGVDKNDLIEKGSSLFIIVDDIINSLGVDMTIMEVREILVEDNLECLDSDAPEFCVVLLLLDAVLVPKSVPSAFKSNTNLSPAQLAEFLNYFKDIENLMGQNFSSDQIDWIFESDENFLITLELLGFSDLYPNNPKITSFLEEAFDALVEGLYVDASEGIIYYDDGVMEQQGPYIWTGPRERIPSSFQTSDGTNVAVTFGTTSDGINADQEVADILVEALLDAIDEANQNLPTNEKITEIYISCTTNGLGHGPLSNHYGGTAFDLSRINGTHINALGANNQVTEVSESLANHQYMREIYSPSHHLRRLSYDPRQVGEATNVAEHNTHIHFAARNH